MVHIPPRPDLWILAGLVENVGTDAVNRVRRRPVRWWREPSGRVGSTRADVVADLVAAYAVAGQAVEAGAVGVAGAAGAEGAAGADGAAGAAGDGTAYRTPRRPSREPVLADQLAVVAYDLVLALRAAAPGAAVEALAAGVLADTLVLINAVDPRPLPEDAAGAAVAWLHPQRAAASAGDVASLGELLLLLERDPRRRDREV